MQRLIKGDKVVEEQKWTLVEETDTETPTGAVIVPLQAWLEEAERWSEAEEVGVLLQGEDELEPWARELGGISLICINFPTFADGRGYSQARLLRERYGWTGELRAVGDVLRDQLFYLKRCGFDAFELREDQDPHKALKALQEFSVTYQADAEGRRPIYRQT